ncbi:MAG: ACT domain-containing protein [Anaerolineae bacterium]|nr:ACT domain-containing protein [Anaerolineae bacterium]MCB9131153.1 ACT domain-containing protein [Anaerolineales bacterium]MCB0230314.1 ACT domain-containing protein [Anaerolineae bacterium]MCB0234305.1 ACT domain-containing protein [Anaerolineae bacterium]MCB0240085.1 ACT domain-containing protein [Anaerolineae bacterium]
MQRGEVASLYLCIFALTPCGICPVNVESLQLGTSPLHFRREAAVYDPLTLTLLPCTLAICRLDPAAALPDWAAAGSFYAATRTPEELSIVCEQHLVHAGVACQRDWRCLKVAGPLDFALTGVLARLAAPLADAAIPVFVISTYDTDYLLVQAAQLAVAITVLRTAGHTVI